MVKIDLSEAKEFFTPEGPDFAKVSDAHRTLAEGTGLGSEYTGWIDLPRRIIGTELKAISTAASKIRRSSEVLIVIGIGGSYLGARAAIEFIKSQNYNLINKNTPEIYFAGNGLSAASTAELIEIIGSRDFSLNVISKSGATLEPAIAFRILKKLLDDKYGSAAKKRIYVTTDQSKGILHDLAVAEGWERFVIPDDVGGRYSVLSAVGLLPMAVVGIDIERVLSSAVLEMESYNLRSQENPVWLYAGARQHLYKLGRNIEVLACYEPSFRYMAEWWKQLFAESEGKSGVGIFPAYVEYSADLHSMGQYIQDGPRRLFETVVNIENSNTSLSVPFVLGDRDGLNYIAGREMSEISKIAARAVASAHVKGHVPNIIISVPERNEEGLASLICFFEMSCAVSAYVSGVNPFNQPGVEEYKSNMFRMLGKQ